MCEPPSRTGPFDERRAAGEDAPLLGVPIAVKEETDLAGLPTTFGTDAVTRIAQRDAETVARLRRAGDHRSDQGLRAVPVAVHPDGVRGPHPQPVVSGALAGRVQRGTVADAAALLDVLLSPVTPRRALRVGELFDATWLATLLGARKYTSSAWSPSSNGPARGRTALPRSHEEKVHPAARRLRRVPVFARSASRAPNG